LAVVPKILPVLLHQLSAMTESFFVLPYILSISSDVAIVLLKGAAVSRQVLPILLQIQRVLSYVLRILACISLSEVGLSKDRTATHDCHRHAQL
jgi:hypothetical protein